jgi:hypothetical protein
MLIHFKLVRFFGEGFTIDGPIFNSNRGTPLIEGVTQRRENGRWKVESGRDKNEQKEFKKIQIF